MTPWKAAASLSEPGFRPGLAPVAGLVTQDPTLRQELPPLLMPETAVVHLDPAGPMPCQAPVHLLMIDSDLLLRTSRARWQARSCLPRLLLAREDGLDRLEELLGPAFPQWMDDMVVWPCHGLELRWRVGRLLERGNGFRVTCGPVVVDQARLEAWVAGHPLALTPREFGVLRELARHCDRAVARRELLAAVWGWDGEHASNVVDVAVAGLRRKLTAHAGLIRTVRGVGYRLALAVEGGRSPGPREP